MVHHIDIDHRKSKELQSGPRHVERRDGRIRAAYVETPEEVRRRLEAVLSANISGDVRFDPGSRALYATDASNYRQVPLGVVAPKTIEDVLATIKLCHQYKVPITSRGGGTSLAGETCNVAVIIDFSRYLNRITWLDTDRRLASVEPGCILDDLRDAAEEHGLTFGPDPSTHDHNTLGGMIGNNSCGVHSIMAGRTSDNVETLDIVTVDGIRMTVGPTTDEDFHRIVAAGGRKAEIYRALDEFRRTYGEMIKERFPKIPRRVSGYENLDDLLPENGFNVGRALVGTEGTCVTVLGATLTLMESPPARVLAILGFDDIFQAADAVPDVLTFDPIGLEGIDDLLIKFVREKHLHPENAKALPEGNGWLLVEFGGETADDAAAKAARLVDAFKHRSHAHVVKDHDEQGRLWSLREAGLPATAHVPHEPETWPGWEDSAVPREALGDYLRDLKALYRKHGYEASVYGHFGDGLVHCRVPFNLRTEQGLANWQAFLNEAAKLVTRYGGSLSGEHGDGQARAELLETMYGPELVEAFRVFKRIWDPDGIMNPGKVVDPYPITSNLRIGPSYQPPEVATDFAFAADGGSFAKATRRCVGVGKCRRTDAHDEVMCPSYMATGEEKYSTRGRARLLFEMLHGGAITDGFKSAAVEEALDLCLACKGCQSDCPVHVDMATYKAEFRSKHYAGRLRPLTSYTMGLIHRWARIAAFAPSLANFVTQTPGLDGLVKRLGGIAPQRTVPKFAPETFVSQFRRRPAAIGGRRVLLWPDTFNNSFRPETAMAATEVLEVLGYEVTIPNGHVCCGRPLYDWGRLDAARNLWRKTFKRLETEIAAGTPIVGLEPACLSAFRDELPSLFPGNAMAKYLSENSFTLTEFLAREEVELPSLADRNGERPHALAQFHCHHHAVLDTDVELTLLGRLGIDVDGLNAGCCGMAGAFGFEAAKYDVSMTAGERVLLPAVRAADLETVIIADGFSCREQIEQGTGRRTYHVAEIFADRLRG